MSKEASISLWDASAAEQDYRNDTLGDVSVDVAIVGGGFTGLSTALHCAEKGLSAHVLEAEQIGFGGRVETAGW
ncbi:FAD-dependent oxidoreductase [Roseobacteraceae bacterium S113]